MFDTVLKVENLSKSYQIGHQASAGSAGERYTALRDVLANARKTWATVCWVATTPHLKSSGRATMSLLK